MKARAAVRGTVYLAGAGPGDPEMLTVRALGLLETATTILHDDLVSDEILALANPAARLMSVGKRCGQARVTQAEINAGMVGAARAGEAVLRLKSGDPLIFGRVAEELDALRAAGVPVEIVPGITAAFAAAAALQVPLTSRTAASRLILATGQHTEGRQRPIWTGALPAEATLALYMPGRGLRALAEDLVGAGMAAETPVAAVSCASTARQRAHRTVLGELREEDAGPAPLLLLIGRAIADGDSSD